MSGRRFAILIVSSRFPKEAGLPPLQFPENDADGLSDVLRSEERGHFNNTVVLKNELRDKVIRELHKALKEARKDELEIFRLDNGHCLLAAVSSEDDNVRAEPFQEIEINLNSLWE